MREHLESFRQYLEYVHNTNGSGTVANFLEDWEPIGATVWDRMTTLGLAFMGENGRIYLSVEGARALGPLEGCHAILALADYLATLAAEMMPADAAAVAMEAVLASALSLQAARDAVGNDIKDRRR